MPFEFALKVGWRSLRQRPLLFFLSFFGIALGVAAIVAVETINALSLESFARSVNRLYGAATHSISAEGEPFPEDVFFELRGQLPTLEMTPLVSGMLEHQALPGKALRLFGIDPFTEAAFRPFATPLGPTNSSGANAKLADFLSAPNAVYPSLALSQSLDWREGQVMRFVGVQGTGELASLGIFGGEDSERADLVENLLLVDIANAQTLLGKVGVLDRIDLRLATEPDLRALQQEQIAKVLGGRALLEEVDQSSTAGQRLTAAFAVSLRSLSLLTLLVGMFLIYNSVSFSVLRQQKTIGRLRALGVTTGEVQSFILGEALISGLLASICGILLGYGLAYLLLEPIAKTYLQVYKIAPPEAVRLQWHALIMGLIMGVGGTLLSAYVPALRASRVQPRLSLSRALAESRFRRLQYALFAVGICLLPCALFIPALFALPLWANYAAVFLFSLAGGLCVPTGIDGVARLILALLGRARLGAVRFAPLLFMSIRNISRYLSRTGMALAALVIGVSAYLGIATMTVGFRSAVTLWIDSVLEADLYLSREAPASNAPPFDSGYIGALAALPEVRELGTLEIINAQSDRGIVQMQVRKLSLHSQSRFRFLDKRQGLAFPQVGFGGILVSEPLSRRLQLSVGDSLAVYTPEGKLSLLVEGVFYDYSSQSGFFIADRDLYTQYWGESSPTGLSLMVHEGQDIDRLRTAAERLAAEYGFRVRVQSSVALKQYTIDVFDDTFIITEILQLIIFLVVMVGIFNAFVALQLDRSHEYGVMRAVGFFPSELFASMQLESIFMGLFGALLAVGLGMVSAWLIVAVITPANFGWSFPLVFSPSIISSAALMTLLATALAGLLPSYRMANRPPSDILQETE